MVLGYLKRLARRHISHRLQAWTVSDDSSAPSCRETSPARMCTRRVLVFEWGSGGPECVHCFLHFTVVQLRSRSFTPAHGRELPDELCPVIGVDWGCLGCVLRIGGLRVVFNELWCGAGSSGRSVVWLCSGDWWKACCVGCAVPCGFVGWRTWLGWCVSMSCHVMSYHVALWAAATRTKVVACRACVEVKTRTG